MLDWWEHDNINGENEKKKKKSEKIWLRVQFIEWQLNGIIIYEYSLTNWSWSLRFCSDMRFNSYFCQNIRVKLYLCWRHIFSFAFCNTLLCFDFFSARLLNWVNANEWEKEEKKKSSSSFFGFVSIIMNNHFFRSYSLSISFFLSSFLSFFFFSHISAELVVSFWKWKPHETRKRRNETLKFVKF